MSIILTIMPEDTKISFIPRDIRVALENILMTQFGVKNTLIGYGLKNKESEKFLTKECGII